MKVLDSQKPKFNIDRVMRERDILAQSNSPNIVQMMYSFEEKDLFFMALEYHPRGNLNGLIEEFRQIHGQRSDALPEPLVRKILADVVSGLDYLHTNGIAHRDLKPENFLVAEDGRIVLADFGLASIHTPLDNPSRDFNHPLGCGIASDLRSSCVGSPLYRAPETFADVLRKHPLPAYSTHLTDVWSLGVVMHELLTGSYTFNRPYAPHEIDDMKDLVREMRAYVAGSRPVFWPADVIVSRHAQSLVEQLVSVNPFARPSLAQIKSHPFFDGVDWSRLDGYRSPFVPVGPSTSTLPSSSFATGYLNVPAPLLRLHSIHVPIYAYRSAEFRYVGSSQLLALNQKRIQQHVAQQQAHAYAFADQLYEHTFDDSNEPA